MTPNQIKLVHTAATRIYGREYEPEYRIVLKNIGGVRSCKDLSNSGLEDVMAFFEGLGFPPGQRWRTIIANRGRFATIRQAWEIRRLAAGREELLNTLVIQQSCGRVSEASKLRPRQAAGVIEALKAILARESAPREVPL